MVLQQPEETKSLVHASDFGSDLTDFHINPLVFREALFWTFAIICQSIRWVVDMIGYFFYYTFSKSPHTWPSWNVHLLMKKETYSQLCLRQLRCTPSCLCALRKGVCYSHRFSYRYDFILNLWMQLNTFHLIVSLLVVLFIFVRIYLANFCPTNSIVAMIIFFVISNVPGSSVRIN